MFVWDLLSVVVFRECAVKGAVCAYVCEGGSVCVYACVCLVEARCVRS